MGSTEDRFPGKTSELVVTNQALPNLQIIKTDTTTGAPIAAAFSLLHRAEVK